MRCWGLGRQHKNLGDPVQPIKPTFITSELLATNLLCGFGNLRACIASRLGLQLLVWRLYYILLLHGGLKTAVIHVWTPSSSRWWPLIFFFKLMGKVMVILLPSESRDPELLARGLNCRSEDRSLVQENFSCLDCMCQVWILRWHFSRYLSTVWTTLCLPIAKVALGQCHWTAIS